jgi:hypothetical protein
MNKSNELQVGDKVKLKTSISNSNKVYKIESVFFTQLSLLESRRGRGERDKRVVEMSEVERIVEEIKPEKIDDKTKFKITAKQRGEILKNLVTEESIRDNFKREIIGVAKLVKKFPHVEFLLEGFKPVIKANTVFYWLNRPEVEQLYKTWAVDLTRPVQTISLEAEKVVSDLPMQKKKAKNLLDLLG